MDLIEIQEKVIPLIREAWNVALSYFAKFEELDIEIKSWYEIWSKHNNSPVTEADKKIEEYLKVELEKIIPWSNFLWEELWVSQTDSLYRWIVDPIDGTREFSRWMSGWAILLALEYKWEIILWITYMPAINEMIYATKWGGAWCGEKKLSVSSRIFEKSYVCHQRHKYFITDGYYDQFMILCEKAGYYKSDRTRSYHRLAQWKIEAVVCPTQELYDIAPYIIIIKEAGGKVTNLVWEELPVWNSNALFSNGVCHDEITSIFNS